MVDFRWTKNNNIVTSSLVAQRSLHQTSMSSYTRSGSGRSVMVATVGEISATN